jgi:hypothetical protein
MRGSHSQEFGPIWPLAKAVVHAQHFWLPAKYVSMASVDGGKHIAAMKCSQTYHPWLVQRIHTYHAWLVKY